MSQQQEYKIIRRPENGELLYIERVSDGTRFGINEEFADWNNRQEHPLNVDPYVFPEGHVVFAEMQPLVEHCRVHGITLFVEVHPSGRARIESLYHGIFCEKEGMLFQLCEIGQRKDGLNDGIQPRYSPVWVTNELFNTLPKELNDPESRLRRVSSWKIDRTFVYLDVSDFSKTPAGQEVLIITSLVRMLNDAGHWIGQGHGLPDEIEARMCIGDGYIFVFREPMLGAYFAAYLAHLIEVLVANGWLAVDFHFRIGVHCGPVYSFWDPGRNAWNYIGEGINGGNRVLSAMGKDYDDTVYISGEVRSKLMDTVDSFPNKAHLLKHLHNRGRRRDKHGGLWRVYEVNHSAVCSYDLHPKLPSNKSL